MKSRISTQRGTSLPKKKPVTNQETIQLELQTKHMEDQLTILKTIVQQQKEQREQIQIQVQEQGSRWKAAKKSSTIKNYAQQLLDEKRKRQAEILQKQQQLKRQQSQQKQTQAEELNQNIKQETSLKPQSQGGGIIPRPINSASSYRSKEQYKSKQIIQQDVQTSSNLKNLQPLNHSTSAQNFNKNSSSTPSNLNKSRNSFEIKDQGRPEEIEKFLRLLNLTQYYEVFLNNDFNSLKILTTKMTTNELKTLGVAPGHQIKIMKSIQQLKDIAAKEQEMNSSSQSFKKSKVSVRNLQPIQRQLKTKIPIQTHEVLSVQTESLNMRDCCWQCFKLNDQVQQWKQAYQHQFCSKQCIEIFRKMNVIKCNKCTNSFSKGEGYLIYDVWFCTQRCSADFQAAQIQSLLTNNSVEDGSIQDDEPSQDLHASYLQEDAQVFNEFITSSLMQDKEQTFEQLKDKYKFS